jgi:hypothetical protein
LKEFKLPTSENRLAVRERPAKRGALHRGRVHHQPYRIRRALVAQHSVEPARQAGFAFSGAPDSALCAVAVDVSINGLGRAEF